MSHNQNEKIQFKVWIPVQLRDRIKAHSKRTHQDYSQITVDALEHYLSFESFLRELEIKILEKTTKQEQSIHEKLQELTKFGEVILDKLERVSQTKNELSSTLRLEAEYNLKLHLEKILTHALFLLTQNHSMNEALLIDALQREFSSTPSSYIMVSLEEGVKRGYLRREQGVITVVARRV